MKNKIIRYPLAKQTTASRLFQFYSFQGPTTRDTKTPHRTSLPHSHDFYEIWFFEKGEGVHYVNFETFDIQPESIHFISPNTIHLVKRNEGNNAYLLAFSAELFDITFNNHIILNTFPAYKQGSKSPVISLNQSDFRSVMNIIQIMKLEQNKTNLFLNASLIHSLLTLILPLFKTKLLTPSANLLVEQFHQLINENFTKHYQISQYAELLELSPVILNRRIKKMTGLNASKHIQERVILEAKRLLVNTDLSVKEIAFQLGFKEPSYFSQYFTSHIKLTPLQFRQKWFENYNK